MQRGWLVPPRLEGDRDGGLQLELISEDLVGQRRTQLTKDELDRIEFWLVWWQRERHNPIRPVERLGRVGT